MFLFHSFLDCTIHLPGISWCVFRFKIDMVMDLPPNSTDFIALRNMRVDAISNSVQNCSIAALRRWIIGRIWMMLSVGNQEWWPMCKKFIQNPFDPDKRGKVTVAWCWKMIVPVRTDVDCVQRGWLEGRCGSVHSTDVCQPQRSTVQDLRPGRRAVCCQKTVR